MRHLNWAALFLSFLIFQNGHADQSRETLFSADVEQGGFGGPTFKISSINGNTNYLFGGKGAWLVDNRYYLGGGGSAAIQRIDANGKRLDFGYGGVIVGYIGMPNQLIHYNVELLIGGGGVTEHMMGSQTNNGTGDTVLVFEPTVNVAINLAPFSELTLGAGYRIVDGVSDFGLSSSALNGWVVNTAILFGKF